MSNESASFWRALRMKVLAMTPPPAIRDSAPYFSIALQNDAKKAVEEEIKNGKQK